MYDLATAHADYADELHEIECARAQADAPAQSEFRNSDEARAEFFEFYTADAKPQHIHHCPTCHNDFSCNLPLCVDWDAQPLRCDACFKAGSQAAAIVEPTPRKAVTLYPNGALIPPSLRAMQSADFYGGIMV